MKEICCHVCGAATLYEHEAFRKLKRVTSDCKPWEEGGRLFTCKVCGCTQALCDETWKHSIQSIYQNYTIYYQGGGEEQRVFESSIDRARSEWLLECISRKVRLAGVGRALDFGCGNGQFLKAFGRLYPQWKLSGVEFDAKYHNIVKSLPGVEEFYIGTNFPSGFDFISLIHVLEHIENPIPFLKEIHSKLLASGLLFVELPSYENNPFELLIVDHATHFTLETAQWSLGQAGFSDLVVSNEWISKELSLLGNIKLQSPVPVPSPCVDRVEGAVAWLQQVAARAREMRREANIFGIFGTSIAATWLATELGSAPEFFVDEDQNRMGHLHMGVPIYAPDDVPKESVVFVAQPPSISSQIVARLEHENIACHYAVA